ncbi:MAG: hypothetical protein ACI90V_007313, partial [Bacillariaceae sp.]
WNSLSVSNDNNFGLNAMGTLSSHANCLKRLVIYDMYYWQLIL